ncbi:MAG TPA: M91 family zinc metallopeptidase [Gemmataceae bacterium]|nr:M91 family zinc metallopeptidase [Gemmataceae bacterium]
MIIRDASFENIVIDDSGSFDSSYATEVAALLATLRKSWTGWAALRAVYDRRKNKRKEDQELRIVPFTAKDRKENPTAAAFAAAKNWTNATARYSAGYQCGGVDDPATPRDDRYDVTGVQGTGVGSSSFIHFNPRDGKRPDCTLLHELVHAVRQMAGASDCVPMENFLRNYDTEEEFYSDVVTNTYLSERGEDDQIRFGHRQEKTMEVFLAWDPLLPENPPTPAGLLNHPALGKPVRRLLFKMTADTDDMCKNIAYKVRPTAKWNLLREYMDNPAKYPMY